jgi:hypothetical protein
LFDTMMKFLICFTIFFFVSAIYQEDYGKYDW